MLLDATRAELWRFWHNGTAIFWGLFFVPLTALITGVFWRAFLDDRMQSVRDSVPVKLLLGPKVMVIGDKLTEKAATMADPALLAFFIIAAATIFATDYRWESWRLIRARNTRDNLIIGKVLAVAILAIVPVFATLLTEAIGQIISATLSNTKIGLGFDLKQFASTQMMIFVSWLRLCQFAMIAAAAAVITRSMAASLIIPLAIGAGMFMVQKMMSVFGWTDGDWKTLLAFPAHGYEIMQSGLLGARIEANTMLVAFTSLCLWLAAPIALAIWTFRNQDLSKE